MSAPHKRTFTPAEMAEIQRDLARSGGRVAVVAQLHACTLDELRAALGDRARLYRWPKAGRKGAPPRKYSPADRETIFAMLAQGYDVPAIAERFGVSKTAMYTNLRRWRRT